MVRTAARLATKLDSLWHALYVETPRTRRLPEARQLAILRTLKLAQDLGAETATVAAQDAVEAVLDYARHNNLGRIVAGRGTRARQRWPAHQAFSQRLGARAPDIDI
jgi:two-component system sensor histidine kinase KdpD